MTDSHTIRLGPAWTLTVTPAVAQPGTVAHDPATRRLDLPGSWPRSDDPVRLVRGFGRPTRGVDGMAVSLRLGRVPGLRAVRLNGSTLDLALPIGPDSIRIVPIADGLLSARNRLELEVDRRGLDGVDDGPWGEIALVFESGP